MGRLSFFLLFVLLFVLVLLEPVRGQQMKEVNDCIARSFSKVDSLLQISRWHDSLGEVTSDLKHYLLKTLPLIPESITANVPDSLRIVKTSSDGKFRQWAWDSWTGGSMPEMYVLLQYKTHKGIKLVDVNSLDRTGNLPDWFDTIYTIRSFKGKTYYLPIIQSKYSNRDAATRIEAYTIEGDKLKKVKLFQTPKKLLSSISIDYDYLKSYDWYWSDANRWVDEQKGELRVPIVEVDSVTDGYLRYQFNGRKFVFKDIKR